MADKRLGHRGYFELVANKSQWKIHISRWILSLADSSDSIELRQKHSIQGSPESFEISVRYTCNAYTTFVDPTIEYFAKISYYESQALFLHTRFTVKTLYKNIEPIGA